MVEAAAELIVKIVMILQKIESRVKTLDLSVVVDDQIVKDLRGLPDRLEKEFGRDVDVTVTYGKDELDEEDEEETPSDDDDDGWSEDDAETKKEEEKFDYSALDAKLAKRIEAFGPTRESLNYILVSLGDIANLLQLNPDYADESFIDKLTGYVKTYSRWNRVLEDKSEVYQEVRKVLDKAENRRKSTKVVVVVEDKLPGKGIA